MSVRVNFVALDEHRPITLRKIRWLFCLLLCRWNRFVVFDKCRCIFNVVVVVKDNNNNSDRSSFLKPPSGKTCKSRKINYHVTQKTLSHILLLLHLRYRLIIIVFLGIPVFMSYFHLLLLQLQYSWMNLYARNVFLYISLILIIYAEMRIRV